MNDAVSSILMLAKRVQAEADELSLPPADGAVPKTSQVIPYSLVTKSRGYIERVTNQVNGCYEHGWYDGCAVMVRRLVETLIIEVYEYNQIQSKIQNQNGDYLYLGDLVKLVTSETKWTLSRNTKRALEELKEIGDRSAHSRYFNAHRSDIDNIKSGLRIVIQELLSIANIKV